MGRWPRTLRGEPEQPSASGRGGLADRDVSQPSALLSRAFSVPTSFRVTEDRARCASSTGTVSSQRHRRNARVALPALPLPPRQTPGRLRGAERRAAVAGPGGPAVAETGPVSLAVRAWNVHRGTVQTRSPVLRADARVGPKAQLVSELRRSRFTCRSDKDGRYRRNSSEGSMGTDRGGGL